jgi:hypothetical protein
MTALQQRSQMRQGVRPDLTDCQRGPFGARIIPAGEFVKR